MNELTDKELITKFFEEHPIHKFDTDAIAKYLKLSTTITNKILNDLMDNQIIWGEPDKQNHSALWKLNPALLPFLIENRNKYPKINTLWMRDEDNKYCISPDDYACEEFKAIKFWHVTEKIDGTNIRIFWDGKRISFGGRTGNAQIPATLIKYLQNTFTYPLLNRAFPDVVTEDLESHIVLYGEGYGPKIQKGGGAYRKDVSFILFDVKVGKWWLDRDSISDIATKLKIDEVHSYGIYTTEQIVKLVKSKAITQIKGANEDKVFEGIVARSHPLMLFRKVCYSVVQYWMCI